MRTFANALLFGLLSTSTLGAGCRLDLSEVPVGESMILLAPGCVANDGIAGTRGVACTNEYQGVTDTQVAENICNPAGFANEGGVIDDEHAQHNYRSSKSQ